MCAVHTYDVFHQKDTTFCDVTLTAYRGIFKEVMSSNRHQDQLCTGRDSHLLAEVHL